MTGTVVYKMSGSGNDFVFTDGRHRDAGSWSPEEIRAVCDRHQGVGADGFVVVDRGSCPGAVRFHFFNNDGGRAAMCGNGALCATRIAAWLELASPVGMTLETDAGTYQSRCLDGSGEQAELILGDLGPVTSPAVRLGTGEREARLIVVAVPHLVVLVDDVAGVDLLDRGRALRQDPALAPDGANVNFVARLASGGWAMRTYERGVEGETLACGTGAVASASVLALGGLAKLPQELRTASGLVLGVSGRVHRGRVSGATLRGEGRLVFRAVVGCVPTPLGIPSP
jgi:diaminopimelate epimerase